MTQKHVKGDAVWSVPTFRGVTHRYALFSCLALAPVAVLSAETPRALVAAWVFALAHVALFGASAAYHGIFWPESKRLWMRRLDHTMIYVLIAGGYTPFGIVLMDTPRAWVVLWVLWGIAAVMVPVNLLWTRRPKSLNAALAIFAGWVTLLTLPDMLDAGGWRVVGLLLLGGFFHTAGAIAYGLKKPNLKPGVFEYHEFFHAVMLVGIGLHYLTVLLYVLPISAAPSS